MPHTSSVSEHFGAFLNVSERFWAFLSVSVCSGADAGRGQARVERPADQSPEVRARPSTPRAQATWRPLLPERFCTRFSSSLSRAFPLACGVSLCLRKAVAQRELGAVGRVQVSQRPHSCNIPMESPCCSCKLTRVPPPLSLLSSTCDGAAPLCGVCNHQHFQVRPPLRRPLQRSSTAL